MKFIQKLYDKMIDWSKKPLAIRYLATISFAEATFFPIPPDVMLAPMSLAKPNKAFYFAFITTMASVIGGIIGYIIGYMAYEPLVLPIAEYFSVTEYLTTASDLFNKHGALVVLTSGFAPIPFKFITITAGTFHYNLYLFIFYSFLARGMRFFLVSGCVRYIGVSLERFIRDNIVALFYIGLAMLAVLIYYCR